MRNQLPLRSNWRTKPNDGKMCNLISFASKIAHLESPAKTLCDFQLYMPQSIQFEKTNTFECSTGHCLVTDFICHGQKTCAPLTLFTAFLLRLSTKLNRLNEKLKVFFFKKKGRCGTPICSIFLLEVECNSSWTLRRECHQQNWRRKD